MIPVVHVRPNRLGTIVLLLAVLSGCNTLNPTARPRLSIYSLDTVLIETPPSTTATPSSRRPTLIVNPTHAASGFDSKHIIYVRQAHQLEHYAHSEWNDTPARMLTPLIVASIANSGSFHAVVPTPSAAAGDLRLDSEIIRLQLDTATSPSRLHFTLRSYVMDNSTREVLAWREFDERIEVESVDPYGTVIAANRAVQNALGRLVDFCTETAGRWQLLQSDPK